MSETKSDSNKYNVQFNQAQGPVIGGYAHVEQHFHAALPPTLLVSRDDLLNAIHEASAELRNYPNEITGIHLTRKEVTQIVGWALSVDSKERLGMLLDQPGSGKTVVMRDVLECPLILHPSG